jgi:MFS superfamily sulfate permease-like transporter
MKQRFNWPLWSGLLLAVVAFVTYFAVFAQIEITRDVPWASFLLFAIAVVLLIVGWKRAARKILPSIVTALGILIVGAFTFLVTVGTKDLPASDSAPKVGQKAPPFTLADTNNRPVSLASAAAGSNGVLLVFYRGHW